MQVSLGVCVSTSIRKSSQLALKVLRSLTIAATLCLLVMVWATSSTAQVNTATMSGTVTDPQGFPVKGAKITMSNAGTGAQRNAVTDDGGRYNLVGLPPGQYKMAVDGGASFAVYENPSLVLTVGEAANVDAQLQLRGREEIVIVPSEAPLIEDQKSDVSSTIDSRQITNLPINGRSYINFTLINSQTTRDMAPTIGLHPIAA